MSIPTAHWLLDDNLATSVVLDYRGTAHGVLYDGGGENNTSNQSTTDAVRGRAFNFVAADNDYVSVAANATITVTSAWSCLAWFKTETQDGNNKLIFEKFKNGDVSTAFWADLDTGGGNDRLQFGVRCTNNTEYSDTYSITAGTLTDGEWHLGGLVFDKSLATERLKLFVDAVKVDSLNATALDTVANNTSKFVISYTGLNQDWDGQIDNVMFWNSKALSAEEIENLWNFGDTSPPKTRIMGNARVWGSGRLASGTGRITPGASRIR